MGQMVEGRWTTQWYDTKSTGGKFERARSSFRNWITPDGSAGPSGDAGFAAEGEGGDAGAQAVFAVVVVVDFLAFEIGEDEEFVEGGFDGAVSSSRCFADHVLIGIGWWVGGFGLD